MVINEQKSELIGTNNGKTDRRQRRSEETRARIFEAAVKLFAKHGFPNVTVEQITEAADVGKGTFFNYFPTKEHLLVAMAEVRKDLVAEAARAAQGATTVKPLILRLVMNMAQARATSQIMMRSTLGAAVSNDVMMKHFQGVLAAARNAAAAIMKRGQELGEIRSDIPHMELARMMQTVGFGTVVLWTLEPEPADLEAWLTQSMENFWRGIVAERTKPDVARPETSKAK
jgi:AcrR family transcriptional regulator